MTTKSSNAPIIQSLLFGVQFAEAHVRHPDVPQRLAICITRFSEIKWRKRARNAVRHHGALPPKRRSIRISPLRTARRLLRQIECVDQRAVATNREGTANIAKGYIENTGIGSNQFVTIVVKRRNLSGHRDEVFGGTAVNGKITRYTSVQTSN